VGVNRCCSHRQLRPPRFPHTRGGEPIRRGDEDAHIRFSPHPWG